jgi:hypothetical protein
MPLFHNDSVRVVCRLVLPWFGGQALSGLPICVRKAELFQLLVFMLGLIACETLAVETSVSNSPVRVLEDWAEWPSTSGKISNAVARPTEGGWLELCPKGDSGSASLLLKSEGEEVWNLEAFAEIAMPVRNLGSNNIRVVMRVDDRLTKGIPAGQNYGGQFEAVISPGKSPVWLVVPLGDRRSSQLAGNFLSMIAKPIDFVRPGSVNGANVVSVSLYVVNPQFGQSIAVGPVTARGIPAPLRQLQSEEIFPIVDIFGQYTHRDWPGKIHSARDMVAHRESDESDLITHQRPKDWDRFGGWLGGPQFQATGFFRVEKIGDRWWMIDPDGRLFWSHGVVRVGTRIRVGGVYRGTPLAGREEFFRLPAKNSPFSDFYGAEPQATRGYYVGKDNHVIYDFLEANLLRKYGFNWITNYAETAQRRLGSWGLNTIANSSDPKLYLMRKTPYTAIVYTAPLGREEQRIAGSSGAWGKFPDPFDPEWRRLIITTLQTELKASLDDPWCLGFFADNEMHWGDAYYLAEATIKSPQTQPAKRDFADKLVRKYRTIEALNVAWKSDYKSWDAFLISTNLPNRLRDHVRFDLAAFSERIIEEYFRSCRDAIKAAAPNHLYLGCRFAGANDAAMKLAAQYCDVVSLNRYQLDVSDLALPHGCADRPILIGEFHFTALDGGMFPPGLVLVANQTDRARAYGTYVTSALRNPAVIGAHWFQFYDQPTTGRFDGENFQTGLIDICDTPYEKTVDAVRQTGMTLYQTRMGASTTLK